MATNKSFKPQNMRSILAITLALVILGGGALFYFGLQTVRTYAEEVNNRLKDADASDEQLKQLQILRNQLAQNQALITNADRVFSTPAEYQSQALNDIRTYAAQTGVIISSTAFDDPTTTNLYTLNLTLSNPTTYSSLIQFLTLIEGNLPKMQVTSINLTRVPGADSDLVEVGDIKINILVR